MLKPPPFSRPPSRLATGLVVALVALNLRPALTGVAPVLAEIMRATGLGAGGASALATLPVLCLGLAAATAPPLVRRLGMERAVVLTLAVIVAGLALRGAGGIATLFAGSLLAGCGIGLGNVLMPAVLKRDFSGHPALMTGIYTTALCLGAAAAAGLAVPLLAAVDGAWAASLALWALPAVAALLLAGWVWRGRIFAQPPRAVVPPSGAMLLRSPLAWQVTLFMGLQSMLAYAVFAWLAPMLRSRGDDPRTAGLVVSVCVLSQMAASLPTPILAGRRPSQAIPAALSVLLIAASFLGLARGPLAWQWGFSVALGLGAGAAFALAIMLMVLRSADGAVAAGLSSMAQAFGYTMAAFGPLLVGLLHARTGDWSGAEALFVAAGLAAAAAGVLAGRPLLLRGTPAVRTDDDADRRGVLVPPA